MKSIRTLVLGVVVVMTCFAGSFSLQAADEPGPLEKLGRGIANVALSPLEMIKRPVMIAHQKGEVAGLFYGPLDGVKWILIRIGVGVTDIVTFPMPLPGCNENPDDPRWGYGPMVRPAWVMGLEDNWRNFFYKDTTVVVE